MVWVAQRINVENYNRQQFVSFLLRVVISYLFFLFEEHFPMLSSLRVWIISGY